MARNLPKQLQVGLIGWWDSNGKNLVSISNNATITGTPSKIRVLQNDGNLYNSTANYGNCGTLGTLTEATFNVWINVPTIAANYTGVLACYNDSSPSTSVWEIVIANSAWSLMFQWFSLSGATFNAINSWLLSLNKWYMATLVIQNGWTKFYIDSNLIWTNTNTGINFSNFATMPITLGTDNGNGSRPWNNKNINSMVYNRALPAKEVEMLYYSTFIK